DLHGITRVQYLDLAGVLLREIALSNNGTDSLVTDYNYVNDFLVGKRESSGIRHCFINDEQGRILQSTDVPAKGFSSEANQLTTLYKYDDIGQLADVIVDPLGTPERTHYNFDGHHRIESIDHDVRPGVSLRTSYEYPILSSNGNILSDIPSKITYPDWHI